MLGGRGTEITSAQRSTFTNPLTPVHLLAKIYSTCYNKSMSNITEKTTYELLPHEAVKGGTSQPVSFVYLGEDGEYVNGTTLEEMLRISIEHLSQLNDKFPCRENSLAITKMQEARMWLNERTRDRRERGVEGKHEK